MSHAALRRTSHAQHAAKLRGYAEGGDVAQDKAMIKKAIMEHENHEHDGKHTRLKLKDGGMVAGKGAMPRMDRARHARGGATKGHGKGAHVNVIVGAPGGAGLGHPVPVPVPVPGGAGGPPGMPAAMPPRPPMGPPPPGMGPPGMGMPPPGMMPHKRGGRVGLAKGGRVLPDMKAPKVDMDDGAGGGLGRLEKIKDYGKNADEGRENHKRGGRAKRDMGGMAGPTGQMPMQQPPSPQQIQMMRQMMAGKSGTGAPMMQKRGGKAR